MTSPFASLRHRSFRLFWSGQCVSQIGTWMQNVAQDWLVLQLTNSPFKLGLLVAAKFVPMMVLPLLAGVVAERYPKRNILLITQSCLLLQAAILAVLTWTGVVRYEYLLALVFCWGIVNGFDMPTRQAIVMELANRQDLMNAIALNSAVFNAARLVGPALAGLALAQWGAPACFSLNAASFLAVIAGLSLIPAGRGGEGTGGVALAEITSGLRYIWAHRTIRDSLILMAILNVFAMNFNVLIPTFAKFTLAGDSRTLGYLWAAIGLGALNGAIALATFSHRGPQRWMLVMYGLGLCLGEIGVSFTRTFPLAIPFIVLTGLSMTSFNATANTTLQINADDRYRSRVMSIYAMVLGGFTAFGSIIAGSIAQAAGPPAAFLTGGSVGLVGLGMMLLFWYRRWRREMKGQDTGRAVGLACNRHSHTPQVGAGKMPSISRREQGLFMGADTWNHHSCPLWGIGGKARDVACRPLQGKNPPPNEGRGARQGTGGEGLDPGVTPGQTGDENTQRLCRGAQLCAPPEPTGLFSGQEASRPRNSSPASRSFSAN